MAPRTSASLPCAVAGREDAVHAPIRVRVTPAVRATSIAAEQTCCLRTLAGHLRILLLPLLQDINHELKRVVWLCLQELGRYVLEHNAEVSLIDPLRCVCLCGLRVFPVLCTSSVYQHVRHSAAAHGALYRIPQAHVARSGVHRRSTTGVYLHSRGDSSERCSPFVQASISVEKV